MLYQKALREYVSSRWQMDRMATATERVSRVVSGWKTASPGSVNGTLEKSLSELPNAATFEAAIQRWKDAHRAVVAAWDAIQPDDRIGLLSPEDFRAPDEPT